MLTTLTRTAPILNRIRLTAILVAISVGAVACQTAEVAGTSEPVSEAPATAAATITSSPSPSVAESPMGTESAGGGDCLDGRVLAAIDELDGGELNTDPPRAEVADALEGLPMDGTAAEARDAFVDALREDPPNETNIVVQAMRLQSEIALPEC